MKVSKRWVYIVGAVLCMLYGINFFYAYIEAEAGGTFGDTFGAVNALFSGSALFFLVLAFLSQREELNLVREERDDTRKLLQGQEDLGSQQKRALDRQVFEQSFNALLQLAIQERNRLLAHDVVGGSRMQASIERSGACASSLFDALNNQGHLSKEEDWNREVTCDAFPLFNFFVHLATMVDQLAVEDVMRAPLRQILTSLLTKDMARTFAWFIVETRIFTNGMTSFEQVGKQYNLRSYLKPHHRSTFDKDIDFFQSLTPEY